MGPPHLPIVQRRLPSEGLETFMDRPWRPVVNAFNHAHTHPEAPGAFPLRWVAMAPNSARFLASLGRPLAIAHDLESRPGIWWLATPDGQFDYVIFSDSHRKNAWKGGQMCMAHEGSEGFTPQHPGLVALCQGFQEIWGQPDPSRCASDRASPFEAMDWFETHVPVTPHWPVAAAQTALPRSRGTARLRA